MLEAGSFMVAEHVRSGRTATLIAWSLPGAPRHEVLRVEELQAALRRARGTVIKVIAIDLGLTAAAVTRRVSAAMRKLHLRSTAELVRLFASWPDDVAAMRLFRAGDEGLALTYGTLEWPLPPCLTAAERRVVRALVDGKSPRAIARERGVSSNTVSAQLATTYRKLQVQSRTELLVALHRLAGSAVR
jgi:DNA-binding NarL/FixJ family response regulator